MDKHFQKLKYFFAYFLWATFLTPTIAMADIGNAVADIMNNERFQGAISSIEWLTTRVDYWFTVLISATAFFIISAALLKNACAGAYVANPKFWNKVAEAHQKADAVSLSSAFGYFKGKQFLNTNAGSFKDALLSLVPNIRALTDFDDVEVEPKQYFMKAIPQMLACVIIGVFIYNGYYRDTAATVGSFGSEVCNRVFSSIEPATLVDKLTQTSRPAKSLYADDPSLEGQAIFEVSTAIYKKYMSVSKGLTETEAKDSLMRDCEYIAYNLIHANTTTNEGAPNMQSIARFFEDKENREYDYTVTNCVVTPMSTSSAAEKAGKGVNVKAKDETDAEIYVQTVQAKPNSDSYAPESAAFFNLSFTLKGSIADRTKQVTTGIKAVAGSWNSTSYDPATITVTGLTQSKNNAGQTVYSGTYRLVEAGLKVGSKANNIRMEYGSDSQNKVPPEAIIKGINGYNAGGGQNPSLTFNKAQAGTTMTVTVTYYIPADTSNNQQGEGGSETDNLKAAHTAKQDITFEIK